MCVLRSKFSKSHFRRIVSDYNPVKGDPSGQWPIPYINGGIITSQYKIGELTSAYANMMEQMQPTISKITEAYSGMWAVTEAAKSIQKAIRPKMEMIAARQQMSESLTKISEAISASIAPSIKSTMLAKKNMMAISDMIAKNFPKYDFSGIVAASSALSNLNFEKLTSAAQLVFDDMNWSEDFSIDSIADRVADSYVAETDEERKTIRSVKSENADKGTLNAEEKALRQSYLQTVFAILSFIATMVSIGISLKNSPEVPSTITNNVQYVNNYYIENGYDNDFLNDSGLRITNRDIRPRLKPDCSSKVTGYLSAGKVVSISDKYKKWILITWSNEDGDYVSGWIQNYKVSEFEK